MLQIELHRILVEAMEIKYWNGYNKIEYFPLLKTSSDDGLGFAYLVVYHK